MLLVDKLAGPYVATWGGLDLGLTDQSGFEFMHQVGRQGVTSDQYGPQTRIDDIEIGGGVMVRANFVETAKPGLRAALNSVFQGGVPGKMAIPGTSVVGVGNKTRVMVLRPQWADSLTSSHPDGDVITANVVGIAADQGTRWAMNSQLQIIPVMFIFYPYLDGGAPTFYTRS